MNDVIERVREELRRNQDPETLASGSRYFKEHVSLYGVKTARVTSIARAFLKEVAPEGKEHVFALCESLWQSGYMEECFIACEWSYSFRSQYVPEDFPVFERWNPPLYVTQRAACTRCVPHRRFLRRSIPRIIDNLKSWAHSMNAAAARCRFSLIIPLRKGRFHNDASTSRMPCCLMRTTWCRRIRLALESGRESDRQRCSTSSCGVRP
jgi:hypothetical protein